jgi:protein CpxP
MDFGLRGIDLSDAQREQLRSVMQSHRDELAKAGEALREAQRAFGEAVRGGADEGTIRARSSAVANAMADEAIVHARVRSEVHGLLTAEQLQQMKDRQAASEKRQQDRRERQKQRLEQRQQRQQRQQPPQ